MSNIQLKEFLKNCNDYVLVILQFCIIILHFIRFDFFFKKEIIQVNSILNLVGFSIVIISSFFILIAIKEIGTNFSTFPKPKDKSYLTTSGIYSFIRHPMYYSLILISFGIFLTKLSCYYLSLTIMLTLIINSKIYLEEKYLINKFKNYSLYKDKVKY